MQHPSFWSLAFEEIVDPDYAHVTIGVLPAHATADPAAWARNLFSYDALPRWISGPLTLGHLSSRASRPAYPAAFAVRRVEGDEALVGVDGRRMDLRVGIGVDERNALVRVIAAVRFKGAHTPLWVLPARVLLPFVVRGMLGRSRRALSGATSDR
ncbi:hypothetical protein ASD65_06655 [Microbacterium sp. Root61]|nr:hypothetical protein ASD65_06655 [Microbacterium sp. Root61]